MGTLDIVEQASTDDELETKANEIKNKKNRKKGKKHEKYGENLFEGDLEQIHSAI